MILGTDNRAEKKLQEVRPQCPLTFIEETEVISG
jgi:hypothetical protein